MKDAHTVRLGAQRGTEAQVFEIAPDWFWMQTPKSIFPFAHS